MGKLLETIQAKLNDLDQRAQEQEPDYQADPKAALDYIKRRNAVDFERAAIRRKLIGALRKLPKDRQDEFYNRCIQPAARNTFTKARYDDLMDPESANGKKENNWILRNSTFGQNWQRTVEIMEEFLGPEEVESLSEEIEETVAPTNPAYPEDDKTVYTMENEIEEIKNSLNFNLADYSLNVDLLDAVKEDLAVVSEEVREEYNKIDQPGSITGYQSMVDQASYDMQNRFLKQDLENGKYGNKFPTMDTSLSSDGKFYTMNDVVLSENGNFRQQDLDEIKQVKPQISEDLKNDILSVTDKLESFGEDKFKNEYTTRALQDSGGKGIFASEQGFKFYAYWPLDTARKNLVNAVRSKDIYQIRQAHEAYQTLKGQYDEMLQTVQKHPTGLSVGNVNSTRALPGGVANPLPLNHMEDFVGQSQLNGLFCLYALSKNTNSTPKQLLEDPVKVMSDAGERHVAENGLGSRKTTGEKLYWGLSERVCDNFGSYWIAHTGQLCTRAFDNVACMASDPKEQNRIAGTGQLAFACGTVPVNAHIKAWENVYRCPNDKQQVLLQHAVLLPAEEFDPLAIGAAFGKPDWKAKLDTGALIDRLKQEGKLDYEKLAGRVEEIAAEAMKCNQMSDSKFDRDKLIKAAHPVFQEILKKATPQERETEAFKKFEEYTNKMLRTTDEFEAAQANLEEQMDVQKEAKTGLFLSSTNTEEHDRMVRAQNTYRYKLRQMQGKELPAELSDADKEALKAMSLKEAYETARDATFDYAVKKTDHGRSDFFVHGTGARRYNASLDSLEIMDDMADTLGLRTPAQKMIDETRLEILQDRRDGDWTKDSTERAAAKIMYAMTYAHLPAEEQAKKLDPKKVEMGIAYIRGQDAFKQMMKNEGAEKLMDKIEKGQGNFTDAYVKAMNDVAKKNHQPVGKAPQEMALDEKRDVWKQNQIPL